MAFPEIAVLSTHRHPRLRYVCRVLTDWLGWRFVVTTDPTQAGSDRFAAVLHYGIRGDTGGYRVPAHRFLSGAAPRPQDLSVTWLTETLPLFFAVGDEGFDLFSACFFALSRYEEYQPFTADPHGRFPATESHAHRNGYLDIPVAYRWALHLSNGLRDHYPRLGPVRQQPNAVRPTYDIDQLFAWHYRGTRGLANVARDLLTGHPRRAAAHLRHRFLGTPSNDPFYAPFVRLLHAQLDAGYRPYIFWLLTDRRRREDNNPYPIPALQLQLMRELAERGATMGIHPGYASNDNEDVLDREIRRFTEIFGHAPRHSRQHFLRLRFPDTLRRLRARGISHDHTMGYADHPGWRAGTNLPFAWYDLERETPTGLTLHPFAFMDQTFKKYRALPPEVAVTQGKRLLNTTVGEVGILWHNNTLTEWYGWEGYTGVLPCAEALRRHSADGERG